MELVPVSRDTLGKMRVKPTTSFAYAQNLPVIRVLASEATQIALSHPIVFLKEADTLAPFAVLGLRKEENLFVTSEGQWLGVYLPAMLRRYPFFAGKAANGAKSDDLTLLVDKASLSETEGEPLFGPDEGEPKGPAAQAIKFLAELAMHDQQTAIRTKALVSHGLLDPFPMQVTRGTDAPENLSGMQSVNEAKLNALPNDVFLEFRQNGALALAYAQLISLGQFGRLRTLATAKLNKERAPAG